METQVLNEYVFAKLVGEWGLIAHEQRIAKLIADGALPEVQRYSQPLTEDDLHEGFRRLEKHRLVALALLQESQRGGAAPTNPMEQRRTGPPPE